MHAALVDFFLANGVPVNRVIQCITAIFRPSVTPDANSFQVILVAEITGRGTTQAFFFFNSLTVKFSLRPTLHTLPLVFLPAQTTMKHTHIDFAQFWGHYIDFISWRLTPTIIS